MDLQLHVFAHVSVLVCWTERVNLFLRNQRTREGDRREETTGSEGWVSYVFEIMSKNTGASFIFIPPAYKVC